MDVGKVQLLSRMPTVLELFVYDSDGLDASDV